MEHDLEVARKKVMNNGLQVQTTQAGAALPALIAHAGEKAAWRFLEFFTVNNRNTRAAFVWSTVRRRASGAGIETAIGCHTFRATGITDYLTNGGRIGVAQRMAGHSNAKTTGLYDRRNDDISVGEVERIGI